LKQLCSVIATPENETAASEPIDELDPIKKYITYWIPLELIGDAVAQMHRIMIWACQGPIITTLQEMIKLYWSKRYPYPDECDLDKANHENISEFLPHLFQIYEELKNIPLDPEGYPPEVLAERKENLAGIMQEIDDKYRQYLDFIRARRTFAARRKQEEGKRRLSGFNPYIVLR